MEQSESRATLAANLRRMIETEAQPGQRPSVRAWAMKRDLDVRMIDRLTKGQHAVTLDKLEEIAAACGLKPWHLLIDDLDPASPPDMPITAEDRDIEARALAFHTGGDRPRVRHQIAAG
jgi:acyl transferase domain-containing protein